MIDNYSFSLKKKEKDNYSFVSLEFLKFSSLDVNKGHFVGVNFSHSIVLKKAYCTICIV